MGESEILVRLQPPPPPVSAPAARGGAFAACAPCLRRPAVAR
jgi:hypothetical protein